MYLARAIQAFVMYCVNGTSRSSLLIESTDSMIIESTDSMISPAVFIYLRLYLYISGCTYISLAVFIYLRLYLYISGCTYISLVGFINITVCTNFETHGAPYFQGFSNCTAYPVAEF